MRFSHSFLLGLSVASFTGAAQADTIASYQINSTLSDGSAFNPMLNVDLTNVFGTTLVGSYATSISSGYVNETVSVLQGGPGTGGPSAYIFAIDGGARGIYLFFPGGTFAGTLCVGTPSTAAPGCNPYTSYVGYGELRINSATVTPLVASTPEPSSLALLGTGLLGVVAAIRRRLT